MIATPAHSHYHTAAMHLEIAVNTTLAAAVLIGAITGCATREKDPLDEIKALIPKVEERLNRRDLGGLKGMGTTQFESNAFVIDVFGQHVHDSVSLALSRIQQTGSDATLILNMVSQERAGETRELHLRLKGDGRWKIDSYEVIGPAADTNDAAGS